MKITFIKDHQSVYSGNEFYPKGAQADLIRGQTLVNMKVARAGWGSVRKRKSKTEQSSDGEDKS